MTTQKPHVILLGCGNMGGAMLEGWLRNECAAAIDIIDHHVADEYKKNQHVAFHTSAPESINFQSENTVLIVAVKPQILAEACLPIKHLLNPDTLIISIAAGKTIQSLELIFGKNQPIARSMPNTPASIAQGITAAVPNNHVTEHHKKTTEILLSAVGQFLWLNDESDMDAVTAISGSGPAYIFHMIEALTSAAEDLDLPQDTAQKLARQTVIGSALLAQDKHSTSATTLRENVTSPGGTTEAALKILMREESGLTDLMKQATKAAQKRSKELS